MLTDPVYKPQTSVASTSGLAVHKQAFQSIAKCIAALTITCQQQGVTIVNQFVGDIKVNTLTST